MEYRIRNIGKVKEANIFSNGITVIAGYNDTGKSTILKSIYTILNTYRGWSENIRNERRRSVQFVIRKTESIFDDHGFEYVPFSFLTDLAANVWNYLLKSGENDLPYEEFKNLYTQNLNSYQDYMREQSNSEELVSDCFIRDIYEKIIGAVEREDAAYENLLITRNIQLEFNQQISSLGNDEDGQIIAIKGKDKCKVSIAKNKIKTCMGVNLGDAPVLYIQTRNILDEVNQRPGMSVGSTQKIRRLLNEERYHSAEEVFEQFDEIENNIKALDEIFKNVLHGSLQKDNDTVKYKDESYEELINIKNVASGMKTFLIIEKLVENGSLKKGACLLIDEPETNLHPDWHLEFAEIMILMKIKLNIDIIVTSHSPYFMRALEVKLADYKMKDKGKFYLMQQEGKMFRACDVTEQTEKIYSQLYKPLEML